MTSLYEMAQDVQYFLFFRRLEERQRFLLCGWSGLSRWIMQAWVQQKHSNSKVLDRATRFGEQLAGPRRKFLLTTIAVIRSCDHWTPEDIDGMAWHLEESLSPIARRFARALAEEGQGDAC